MTPDAAVRCGACRNPITLTETGWTHLAAHGVPETGWLCPMPHMHLAHPQPRPRQVTQTPPSHRRGHTVEITFPPDPDAPRPPGGAPTPGRA